MMVCKAVEMSDPSLIKHIFKETDGSLTEKLIAQGGFPRKIMTLLKYRELYKRAYSMSLTELKEDGLDCLLELTSYKARKAKEEEIAIRAGLHPSEVILDMPERELLISEPRIGKTEVPIIDEDKVRPLSRYSPLAKALQSRNVFDWAVMVSTPEKNRSEVAKAAQRVLFGS
jgi:HD superfamily phosphohydrolase